MTELSAEAGDLWGRRAILDELAPIHAGAAVLNSQRALRCERGEAAAACRLSLNVKRLSADLFRAIIKVSVVCGIDWRLSFFFFLLPSVRKSP